MNWKCLLLIILAAMLSTACMSPMTSASILSLYGDAVPVAAAERAIVITPETKYVNVVGGEIVEFVVDGKSFAWDFDGISEGYVFDLNLAAPPGLLDHRVISYVDPNPKYPNGAR